MRWPDVRSSGIAGIIGLLVSCGMGPPLQAARPHPALWPGCEPPTQRLERVVWEAARWNGPDLSCGNAFVQYVRTPQDLTSPQDAFQIMAQQIAEARSEVLLANMWWNAGPGHPGFTIAQGVQQLYQRVKSCSADYPQGMRVRIFLGGQLELFSQGGLTEPQAVIRDLRHLGVPLRDEEVGWQVSVFNERHIPWSHVKLLAIDGRDLTVSGFNVADMHLSLNRPHGSGLHDLGLRVTGPVAQDGVAVFDDLWRRSLQLHCPVTVTPAQVTQQCQYGEPEAVSHPPGSQAAVRSGEARVFMLYRRPGEDQADRAHLALMDAAQYSIDLQQNDLSSSWQCTLAYLFPQSCPAEQWPVYLQALLKAAERGVKVRILLVDYGWDVPFNRSGLTVLRRELRQRGLSDRLEARHSDFLMHTKALTVDGEMVVVGSMNFHFSAWGQWGLAETALATSDPQAVAEQQTSFEDVWQNASRLVPPELR